MKTGIITDVSTIERDSQGKAINVVVIRLQNGQALIRQLNQFKVDLTNSNRLLGVNLDTVNSVLHPAIQSELPRLKNGGQVTGDWRMVKEGEEYEITNVNDPDFGKVKQYTKDHIKTEGFLSLEPSNKYLTAELTAKETANLTAQLNGLFSTAGSSSAEEAAASEEDIPEEVMAAIAGEQEVEEEPSK